MAVGVGGLTFTQTFTAQPADIDGLGHVNNVVWVRWVQEIAVAHWTAVASVEHRAAHVWVVTRHEVDYRGNVRLGETVVGETQVAGQPKGACWARGVRFTGPDGRVKVEGVSTWALLDRATGRLLRIRDDIAAPFLTEPAFERSSPGVAVGAHLAVRVTPDGEGVSPPLVWGPLPPGTRSVALVAEDADSPTLSPLVHAIVWGVSAETHRLAEGAIVADAAEGEVGRNSFLSPAWLPPDPPTGHGDHRYVFQLFALDVTAEDLGEAPGRGAVMNAMAGHVIGAGVLTGIYARGEPRATHTANATKSVQSIAP